MPSVFPARRAEAAAIAAGLLLAAPAASAEEGAGFDWNPQYWESYGNAQIEVDLFFESPRFPGQENNNLSFALEPTLYAEWLDGDLSATITAFGRVDRADDERTHFDLREAKVDYHAGEWTVTAGVDTVFWGKTEAFHLVDIINQTDFIEDLDDEDALGQPMLRVSRLTEFGTVSAYWLPVFRERTFAGRGGRLRFGLPVRESETVITPDGDNLAQSGALRYDGVFGAADIGLSLFHGVSRDPAFRPIDFVNTPDGPAPTALAPVYTNITQFAFDGQYTDGATLYKGEALFRTGQLDLDGDKRDYFAATGGLEHTVFNAFADAPAPPLRNADLGLILEFAYDSRGEDATVLFQNDVIVGARLALNDPDDTAMLLTGTVDPDNGAGAIRLEGTRRVGKGLVAEVEGQFFVNAEQDRFAADLQDDSYLRFKLTYFW